MCDRPERLCPEPGGQPQDRPEAKARSLRGPHPSRLRIASQIEISFETEFLPRTGEHQKQQG